MQDIVFILPAGSFPVPAINGGAIESLLELLINENERHQSFNLHVLMCKSTADHTRYDYTAYHNTKFYDFYLSPRWFKLNRLLNAGNKRLGYHLPLFSPYDRWLKRQIKQINPTYVIFEGSYTIAARAIAKMVGRDHLLYHLHHQMLPKRDFSAMFGHLLCVSEFIKRDWAENFRFRHPVNLLVWANAIAVAKFNQPITPTARQNLRTGLGFNNADFVVLYVGRLVKGKGVAELITAVKQIDNPHVKLLMVGESVFKNSHPTAYTQQLQTLCQTLPDRVKFTGFIDNDQLYQYYALADVHVLPSRWEEAAGLVLLESRCVGTPQILTDSGGAPEFARADAIIVPKATNLVNNLATAINQAFTHRDQLNYTPAPVNDANYYWQRFATIINHLTDQGVTQ